MLKIQTPSSRALREALQTAAKCISSKNSMAILDCILLSQRDGKFYFTTSTNDSQLTIPAPFNIVGGKYEQALALQPGGLIAYLQSLPECVVTFTIDSTALSLDYCTGSDDKVKTGKVSLTVQSANEFPMMQSVNPDNPLHLVFPTERFLHFTSLAQRFSNDDELRMVMNGLAVDVPEDMSECYFVATNGHKLVKVTYTQSEKTGGSPFYKGGQPCLINIHKKYFKPLSAFEKCETIDIEFDGNTIRFTGTVSGSCVAGDKGSCADGEMELIIKAIEGRYPNYESVIPKSSPYYIHFDKKEMLSVLNRVAVFGPESTNLVQFRKNGMFINIKAEDIDFATHAEDQVLITQSECPDGFAIGFNSKHFADCINAIPGDDICIKLADPSRAAVVTETHDNPTTLTLAMPMLIDA